MESFTIRSVESKQKNLLAYKSLYAIKKNLISTFTHTIKHTGSKKSQRAH